MAEELHGSRQDYENWFKMFRMEQPAQWESCVFFQEKEYIDLGVQMGRFSSALGAQSPSFLIMALEMRRELEELEWRL